MEIEVIDRRHRGDTVFELVRRGARHYAEVTRQVSRGTQSRRTVTYASYEAYCEARSAGTLRWGAWE